MGVWGIKRLFCIVFLFAAYFAPQPVKGFDGELEGRCLSGSLYVIDSPSGFKDFDSEVEIRLGLLGNAWEGETWKLDYEISADANQGDGPSVQSGLRQETKIDFFRAGLRLDRGDFKLRGGRQKILFGA